MAESKAQSVSLPMLDLTLWYAGGLRFSCTQCGNCCSGAPGYVWLTVEEMERIAEFLGMGFDGFTGAYVRRVGDRFSLIEKADHDCIFLSREGVERGKTRCMIHGVRPTQCRTWPFWNQNLKSAEAWAGAARGCPGMRDPAGEMHGLAEIEGCRQESGSPA